VKKPTITTSSERQRAPFGLVVSPTPVAVVCHGALGSTSTGEKRLGLAKAWKIEGLVKG
jgi:hypothetical protein